MTFGEKIKFLRQQKNITQQELADLAGVSLRTIINYEKHNKTPQKQNLYSIFANIFEVDINYLFSDKTNDYSTIIKAKTSDKSNCKQDVLLKEINSFFNDKSVSESEKEKLLLSIEKSYWSSALKRKNKQ